MGKMLEKHKSELVVRAEAEYVKKTEEFLPAGELEQRAYEFILEKHVGQKRDEGSPYTDHLVAVASIMRDWMGVVDHEVIAAALLHDVVEDTPVSLEEVKALFGERVARLVEGVTKLKGGGLSKKERDLHARVEVVRKGGWEPEVVLLKLADRFHNMSTLSHVSVEKQQRKAEETLAVYVPLAESLGVWEVKRALEDLSAFYLHPEKMAEAKKMIDPDQRFSAQFLYHWQSVLGQMIKEMGIEGEVKWQAMGYWEAIQKRDKLGLADFSRVQLVSFRVVVENERQAREVAAETRMRMPEDVNVDRADDFITRPAYNGYSALQETLELVEGSLEIAIATKEGEKFNRFGVVSLIAKGEENLGEYSQNLIFDKEGKVIKFLPKKATGVDLLAAMDPWLLLSVRELIVDGQKMPVTVQLSNAAMVEVVMGETDRRVRAELFSYAQLPKTQEVLRGLMVESRREIFVEQGKLMMMDWLLSKGITDLEDLVFGPGEAVKMDSLLRGKLDIGWSVNDLYYEMGINNRGMMEVAAAVEEVGFVGLNEKLCKIEVEGEDKPGILRDLTEWILSERGTIRKIYNVADGNRYETKLVLSGISKEGIERIEKKMGEDERKRFVVKRVVSAKKTVDEVGSMG